MPEGYLLEDNGRSLLPDLDYCVASLKVEHFSTFGLKCIDPVTEELF
jgi:hypothetical protein